MSVSAQDGHFRGGSGCARLEVRWAFQGMRFRGECTVWVRWKTFASARVWFGLAQSAFRPREAARLQCGKALRDQADEKPADGRFQFHNGPYPFRQTQQQQNVPDHSRALSGSALPAADRIDVTSNASSSAAVAQPRVDRAREIRTVTGAESFSPPCRSSAGGPSGRASPAPAPCPTEGTRPIGTPKNFGIASNQNGVCHVLCDTRLFCAREQKSAQQEVRGAAGES